MKFIKSLQLLSALILAAPVFAAQPNVVIILVDDMGYGDARCYNPDSKIPTPNIDRLAAEGMRFTDGHSSSGICTPSRYALLTGRHHWRDFYGIVNAMGASVFKPERLTLPEMMKTKGYNTACIGKWHLGFNWPTLNGEPPSKGIDPGVHDNEFRYKLGKNIDFDKLLESSFKN